MMIVDVKIKRHVFLLNVLHHYCYPNYNICIQNAFQKISRKYLNDRKSLVLWYLKYCVANFRNRVHPILTFYYHLNRAEEIILNDSWVRYLNVCKSSSSTKHGNIEILL